MAARFWPGMQCALEVVREVWKARVRELGASPKASKVQGEAAGKQPGTGVTSQHGMRGRQPARGSFYSGLFCCAASDTSPWSASVLLGLPGQVGTAGGSAQVQGWTGSGQKSRYPPPYATI